MGTMAAVVKPSWLARLWRRAGGEAAAMGLPQSDRQDPLVSAGILLRQAREARGLNLRQLALETRISTPVLEALERGWRDRLPELAYLRTMLPLLERHLGLERGSLRQALAATEPAQARRDRGAARLPLLSVQLFSTWQGTAVYGVLLLLVLYALNLEQRRLAAQGLLALNPLPPLAERAQQGLPPAGSDLLLDLYPELRPLTQARQGQALAVLRRPEPARAAGSAPPPATAAGRCQWCAVSATEPAQPRSAAQGRRSKPDPAAGCRRAAAAPGCPARTGRRSSA